MLIYAAIGAFGLLFLLVMLFVGEVFGDHDHDLGHDADHDGGGGPSPFSARVMAAFLTAFGVGGVVARYFELGHVAASGVGIASGTVMGGLVWQFGRLLHSQQASSHVRVAGLLGQAAEVTVAIPAAGPGQVTLVVGGERTTHVARSVDGQAIAAGAAVTVTAIRGESILVAPAAPAQGVTS